MRGVLDQRRIFGSRFSPGSIFLQILHSYDQPSALSVVPVLEDIPQVAESAVIMDAAQIEIDCDAALNDQEHITIS